MAAGAVPRSLPDSPLWAVSAGCCGALWSAEGRYMMKAMAAAIARAASTAAMMNDRVAVMVDLLSSAGCFLAGCHGVPARAFRQTALADARPAPPERRGSPFPNRQYERCSMAKVRSACAFCHSHPAR
jgi:hypothetical protein